MEKTIDKELDAEIDMYVREMKHSFYEKVQAHSSEIAASVGAGDNIRVMEDIYYELIERFKSTL